MRRRGIWFVACAILAVILLPNVAYARSAKNTSTNISAVVRDDGTLEVVEQRTVRYRGNYHGFFWDLARGEAELGTVSYKILGAGEVSDGRFVPFDRTPDVFDTTPGTYDVSDSAASTNVDLHFDKSNETATFYVHYYLTGVVARWQDTGELYWKFVGNRWDSTSFDVTCTMYLPAPEGAEVSPGGNVRAWLHHAGLSGEVRVESGVVPNMDSMDVGDAGSVVYKVPGVDSGVFAEARVLFPAEWLSNAEPRDANRVDQVLGEERRWSEEANEARDNMFATSGGKLILMGALCVVTLAVSMLYTARYRERHTPRFDGRYFRDVPSNDHPAALAWLLGNAGGPSSLTATLMRLTDQGIITLEEIDTTTRGMFGKTRHGRDFQLKLDRARADAIADEIDRQAVVFLFDYVAKKAGPRTEGGKEVLQFSSVRRVAAREERGYLKRLQVWSDTVRETVERRGFERDEPTGRTPVIAAGVLCLVLALLMVADAAFFSTTTWFRSGLFIWFVLVCVILVGVGVIAIRMGSRLKKRSAEAVEIEAKLNALKRWFKDFTRLDEAIPQDVVLWNRLLVMAVAMDVSKEVIEQLRIAVPELTTNESFALTMYWCSSHGDTSPASAFSSGFASAMTAASPSSSSGGGGGASGGGGGGGGGGSY